MRAHTLSAQPLAGINLTATVFGFRLSTIRHFFGIPDLFFDRRVRNPILGSKRRLELQKRNDYTCSTEILTHPRAPTLSTQHLAKASRSFRQPWRDPTWSCALQVGARRGSIAFGKGVHIQCPPQRLNTIQAHANRRVLQKPALADDYHKNLMEQFISGKNSLVQMVEASHVIKDERRPFLAFAGNHWHRRGRRKDPGVIRVMLKMPSGARILFCGTCRNLMTSTSAEKLDPCVLHATVSRAGRSHSDGCQKQISSFPAKHDTFVSCVYGSYRRGHRVRRRQLGYPAMASRAGRTGWHGFEI